MEDLKEMFNPQTVEGVIEALSAVGPFDGQGFRNAILPVLETLELKARVQCIADALHQHLPADYPSALAQVLAALPPARVDTEGVTGGFILWPFCDYVERYGLAHPEVSLPALREFTMRFSAEFAIRPYIEAHYGPTMAALETWVEDENPHVRRLVSEGTRPRLPWGRQLKGFMADPSPTLRLLERLKDDESLYVRRSVANHLNDIAKDHPQVVVETCQRWSEGASKARLWLIKHALRSLLKAGDVGAMAVLGFGAPQIELVDFRIDRRVVQLGDGLQFDLEIQSTGAKSQKLIVDYAIHHLKANGTLAPKVFKGRTLTLKAGAPFELTRFHRMKPITTRRYYGGEHRIEILINGQSFGSKTFELKL